MKQLLDKALEKVDEAEVYYLKNDVGSIVIRNGEIEDMDSSILSGYALKVIRDGRLGTAYTANLLDRDELVSNALASLEGGMEVSFSFPGPSDVPDMESYDPANEELTFSELKRRAEGVIDTLKASTTAQVDAYTGFVRGSNTIINSAGLERDISISRYYITPSLLFPNTETSVSKSFRFLGPGDPDPDLLREQLWLYNSGLEVMDIEPGRMKVMFMPSSMYTIFWRVGAATSARTVYDRTSPLCGREGEKIISEDLSIYNDPLDPSAISSTPFDDEGVPTKRLELFTEGVYRSCFANLDYASKLGIEPTGNGFRQGMWGGNPISQPPAPNINHPRIATGTHSFEQLLGEMDRGVIVIGVLGAHSGNILNGDFSVGLSPGLYVENGEVVGRVGDGMVAGNVYDLMRNVAAIENRIHEPDGRALFPCVLFDDVSVTGK